MIKFYLDLETYRPNKKDAFLNEKIIALGLLIDFTSNMSVTPNEIKEYKWGDPIPSFGIWKYIETDENSSEDKNNPEKKIISRFYQLLDKFDGPKMIIGFNMLGFDIPLLVQRSKELNVREIRDANYFFFNTFTVDYFQICLPFNNMRFKGNDLENCARRIEEIKGRKIPFQKIGKGSEIASLYDKKDYEGIKRHLESDLLITRAIDLAFIEHQSTT